MTPPPLPGTKLELISQRFQEFQRTINDRVEEIHLALWDDDPEYKLYLDAVVDSQAKEGALVVDNVIAAQKIRAYAVEHNIDGVRNQNLATINKALSVVLRRYNISRKQRRNMMDGEQVPDDNGEA
jgi:predicted O-methyltransferase YrrM